MGGPQPLLYILPQHVRKSRCCLVFCKLKPEQGCASGKRSPQTRSQDPSMPCQPWLVGKRGLPCLFGRLVSTEKSKGCDLLSQNGGGGFTVPDTGSGRSEISAVGQRETTRIHLEKITNTTILRSQTPKKRHAKNSHGQNSAYMANGYGSLNRRVPFPKDEPAVCHPELLWARTCPPTSSRSLKRTDGDMVSCLSPGGTPQRKPSGHSQRESSESGIQRMSEMQPA